jgi:hypothetical protein
MSFKRRKQTGSYKERLKKQVELKLDQSEINKGTN